MLPSVILIVPLVVISFEIIHFSHAISEILLSCATCFIIASQIKIEKSIIKLEQPVLNFLGKRPQKKEGKKFRK